MQNIKTTIAGIQLEIVIGDIGDYPCITILEKDNPICFVEVDTVDNNIATIAYNDHDEDYANKTVFRKIKE